jgi:predicted amidohydrolase YtcJ
MPPRSRNALVCILVLSLAGVNSVAAQEAELVLFGGRIWTGPGSPIAGAQATAVAVANGRVLAVGSDDAVVRFVGPPTRRIDLEGRRVVPGFMDAHTHFIDGGFELASVRLRDAATPQEFARRIGAFATAHPDGWVTGGTWDHELWGGDLPRRDWIDSLTPDTPVFVSRLDGHMGLANTRALELAGVTVDTPDPEGGTIVRYDDGRPTGILKDAAMGVVARAIPERSEPDLDRALQAAIAHAVERGVTMVTDMGTWEGHGTYQRAYARGELPIRVYSVLPIGQWQRVAEYVELRQAIIGADAAGLHLIVHAIGDRANDWLLGVYQEARELNRRRDRRPRIEHAQHLTPDAIRRMAVDEVIPSMQPYHAIDDGRWAVKRIGSERIETTYAFRGLQDAGAHLAFGSDWTVAPIDPLYGIYAAVTRRTIDGANPGGWVPQQKITVEEALAAYTTNNAYAAFLEGELGTLEPGKFADLVVLSHDVLTIDPVEIERVEVDLTMVAGKVVYERER